MRIAIIAAAGNGTRLGKNIPKALVPIGRYPMLAYSLTTFAAHPLIDAIIISIPAQRSEEFTAIIEQITELYPHNVMTTVTGGEERGDSISAALATISAITSQHIIIHDAARPFTPRTIIDDTISALSQDIPAIIPALPVVDTIKLCNPDGTIEQTLPRDRLVRIQTPQGFHGTALCDAYTKYDPAQFTDDASMVEALGIAVQTLRGSELSRKITHPEDLLWAEQYVQENKIQLY